MMKLVSREVCGESEMSLSESELGSETKVRDETSET